jgi:hypothetical protein
MGEGEGVTALGGGGLSCVDFIFLPVGDTKYTGS